MLREPYVFQDYSKTPVVSYTCFVWTGKYPLRPLRLIGGWSCWRHYRHKSHQLREKILFQAKLKKTQKHRLLQTPLKIPSLPTASKCFCIVQWDLSHSPLSNLNEYEITRKTRWPQLRYWQEIERGKGVTNLSLWSKWLGWGPPKQMCHWAVRWETAELQRAVTETRDSSCSPLSL